MFVGYLGVCLVLVLLGLLVWLLATLMPLVVCLVIDCCLFCV